MRREHSKQNVVLKENVKVDRTVQVRLFFIISLIFSSFPSFFLE